MRPPVSGPHRLIEQPAVHQRVEGVVWRPDLDGLEHPGPGRRDLGQGGFGVLDRSVTGDQALHVSGVGALTQQKQDTVTLSWIEDDLDVQCRAGIQPGAKLRIKHQMAQGRRPSMSDMMRMSSLPSEAHSVELRLGSTLPPKGGPEASHTMPPGAQVNKPIFLQTPEPGRTQGGSPEPYRQPKGQISFYWGCGEKAGAGQPVVLTFDKLLRALIMVLEGLSGDQILQRELQTGAPIIYRLGADGRSIDRKDLLPPRSAAARRSHAPA